MQYQRQDTAKTIEKLLNDPILSKDTDLVNGLTALKNTLDSREYRITVLGEFSSGKSTFLNALIGMDILPHGVEETTGAVTYLHNVAKGSPLANKVKVLFRDESISPIELDLSTSHKALIDFVTVKSSERNVAKDISEVHIYIPYLSEGDNIVLIDTPGLNGIKEGLRDITYREIHRSHANICLFGIKGVSQSDLGFIEDFYKSGTPFFFVLNQIDMLMADEETDDEKINGFRENIKNNILHTDTMPKNVFGVSALQALASRDTSIKKLYKDSEELTPEDRKVLLTKSRIAEFEKELYRFVKDGEIERNFINQVNYRIQSLLTISKDRAIEESEILQAKTSDIPEKKILEEQIKSVEIRFNDNKKIIKNKLSNRMESLEKETVKYIGQICEDISARASEKVSEWDTLEKAETAEKRKVIVNFINNEVARKREFLPNWLSPKLDSIYTEMIDVVRSFVPNVHFSSKTANWQFSSIKEDIVDESEIERIQRRMNAIRSEISIQQEKKRNIDSSIAYLTHRIQIKEEELRRDRESKRREKANLGTRPSFRTWTTERTVKKKFLWVFSYKGTEVDYHNNQDEIDRYDRKDKEIETRHSASQAAIRKTIANLEKNRNEQDSGPVAAMIKKLEAQLSQMDAQKRREMESIDFQKRAAKSRYLKKLKDHAREVIQKALSEGDGTLYLALKDDVRENIFETECRMNSDLDKIYTDLVSKFKKSVKILIDKIEQKADISSQKNRIQTLKGFITKVDLFLSQIKTA